MADSKREKALKARIKQEYKRSTLVLLSGVVFRKDTWTEIPRGREATAKEQYSDILDFEEGKLTEEEKQAALGAVEPKGQPGSRLNTDVQNAVWEAEVPVSMTDSALQSNLDRGATETKSGKSTAGEVESEEPAKSSKAPSSKKK